MQQGLAEPLLKPAGHSGSLTASMLGVANMHQDTVPISATAHVNQCTELGSETVFVPMKLNSLTESRDETAVQACAEPATLVEASSSLPSSTTARDVQEHEAQTESPSDWTYIDLMAGAAGIAFQMSLLGLRVIAVDYVRNKAVPLIPITVIDLTTLSGQETVILMLRGGKVAGVGMSPPCGTSSRSRERPLAKHLLARGIRTPQPLRSEEYPYGLPGLTGSNR